ncbi:hypothetical protein B1H18_18720 [Streptomyces tsukubensis]|uniref:Uncharacterized protein n=1 Tax=Streptomyces tsukubensis TaxID=83656 RepID=A0A1V4A7S0_9ACTN|nr:hypothetical protein B1H18_18720 [Streptomyces tsukubensis]
MPRRGLRLDAARAVLRLTQAARGAFGEEGQRDPAADGAVAPEAFALLAAPMAEADEALRAAGFSGNEAELYRLVGALRER